MTTVCCRDGLYCNSQLKLLFSCCTMIKSRFLRLCCGKPKPVRKSGLTMSVWCVGSPAGHLLALWSCPLWRAFSPSWGGACVPARVAPGWLNGSFSLMRYRGYILWLTQLYFYFLRSPSLQLHFNYSNPFVHLPISYWAISIPTNAQ